MTVKEMLKLYMNNDEVITRIVIEDGAGREVVFNTNDLDDVVIPDELRDDEILGFEVSRFWISESKRLYIYCINDKLL